MSPCLRQCLIVLLILICGSTALVSYPHLSARAVEFLPTTVEVQLSCGDGFSEPGLEVCDPGDPPIIPKDIGSTTCQNFLDIFNDPFTQGDLDCLADCSGYDATSTCYTCGNTNKEIQEECDSSDFDGQTCVSLGFESGSLFCTSDCKILTANCVAMEHEGGAPGGGSSGGSSGGSTGYKPGSDTESVTKVVMQGKSYPHSDVHILVDGKVEGIVRTDAKADFYFETSDVTPGVGSFGFWSEDPDGLKSTLLTLTFRVISGAVTTISGVYIAPTIDLDKNSVRQGDPITIFGKTVPDTKVNIHINSEEEYIETTDSGEAGQWEIVFDTMPLEVEFHTAKALFEVDVEGNIIQSGFSKSVSFHVGKLGGEPLCPEADLNHDGRVNLTDFSILLFHWGTDNACADQNQNGVVDLIDFSIMMYYWTG